MITCMIVLNWQTIGDPKKKAESMEPGGSQFVCTMKSYHMRQREDCAFQGLLHQANPFKNVGSLVSKQRQKRMRVPTGTEAFTGMSPSQISEDLR